MTSLIMAMASRPSCPGLICSQMSALLARGLDRVHDNELGAIAEDMIDGIGHAESGIVSASCLPQTRMHLASIDGNHGITLVLVPNERKEHVGNQLDLRDKSR